MEKLIELLNQYAHTYADHYDDTGEEITIEFYSHTDECFQYVCDGSYETLVDDVVISKRYGFIKWLVENEKVNREQKTKEFRLQIELDNGSYGELGGEARLLMLLSIQDNPIEFLVSILK